MYIVDGPSDSDTIFVKPLAIKDSRESTTTARYYICLRTLPGSIPGTDGATGIDGAYKDRIGAL